MAASLNSKRVTVFAVGIVARSISDGKLKMKLYTRGIRQGMVNEALEAAKEWQQQGQSAALCQRNNTLITQKHPG